VKGVVTDAGESIELSALVSNMDAVRTPPELIGGPVGVQWQEKNYEPACSGCVVLYLGLKKRYEHVLHHNFCVLTRPHEELNTSTKKARPARTRRRIWLVRR